MNYILSAFSIVPKSFIFIYKYLNNLFNFFNTNADYKAFIDYSNFQKKNTMINFSIIDWTLIKAISLYYNNSLDFSGKRISFRIKQTTFSFYRELFVFSNPKVQIMDQKEVFLRGISFFWIAIRFWFLGIILFLSSFYFLLYIRLLPFNKIIFEYILIIMFLYWLLSGFVFFVKKYQFSKFTSVIQRFWKRTYILFWLIESGVFITFFYLTLNASEEPFYMYDQIKIYKTHLFSWKYFLAKLPFMIIIIIFSYFILLSLKWNIFTKLSGLLLVITLILVYLVWLEFYQFFHIINFYGNLVWTYDYDEFLWNLELEYRRTRLANNYVAVCLMAKFWHLIFIFIFWIFFILRINEIGRIRYPLYAANMQNFLILYIMSWLYMYPWLKFLLRPRFDTPYYWFFSNIRILGYRIFFNDIKLFYFSIIPNFNLKFSGFSAGLFYYWNQASIQIGFMQNPKNILKDLFIYNIKTYLTHFIYVI